MCMHGTEPLTLASMLADPLIRMVMRSDGVSEEDFASLWQRAEGALARHRGPGPGDAMVPA